MDLEPLMVIAGIKAADAVHTHTRAGWWDMHPLTVENLADDPYLTIRRIGELETPDPLLIRVADLLDHDPLGDHVRIARSRDFSNRNRAKARPVEARPRRDGACVEKGKEAKEHRSYGDVGGKMREKSGPVRRCSVRPWQFRTAFRAENGNTGRRRLERRHRL